METMIVIGIIALLSVFSYATFISLNKKEALSKQTLDILAILNQARGLTLGSKYALW